MGSTSKIGKQRQESAVKKARVAICVPSGGGWEPDFGRSLMKLIAYTQKYLNQSVELMVLTKESSMLCLNRHKLAVQALQNKADFLLWIDDDMVFPENSLERLLRARKEMVGVNYTTRKNTKTSPVRTIACGLEEEEIFSLGKTGERKYEEVASSGFGLTLIQANVFRSMEPPFFLQDWVPAGKCYCGEDVFFFAKAWNELGLNLWIDHELSVEVEHIGRHAYGHKDLPIKTLPLKKAEGE